MLNVPVSKSCPLHFSRYLSDVNSDEANFSTKFGVGGQTISSCKNPS